MTSIQLNSSESQTTASTLNGGLNQSQTPIRYDEAERVRQRMDDLRRHHAESADIHNRTQTLIDEQIHEETVKYLKTNQEIGTKTKSQKPRAPKRQRTAANSNNNNNSTSANNVTLNTPSHSANNNINLSPGPNSLSNHHIQPPPPQQQSPHIISQQVPPHPQVIMQTSMQPMNPMTSVPYHPPMPHPQQQQQQQQQQQSMHIQSQPRPQNQVHQQTHHHQQHQQYNGPYQQNHYQSPSNYPPQQQQSQQNMQPGTHNQHMQPVDHGGHYITQQGYSQQSHYYPVQPITNNMTGNQQHHNHHYHHNNQATLPFDLDPNHLQDGLDCDVFSLINHELNVEGQLGFNPDLLDKLDNHEPNQ